MKGLRAMAAVARRPNSFGGKDLGKADPVKIVSSQKSNKTYKNAKKIKIKIYSMSTPKVENPAPPTGGCGQHTL